jgi:hypothetical protein
MATNVETMWVGDSDQLEATVQTLMAQGGVVQNLTDTEITLYLKKKINVVVLVVGLILCLVPGLAYLVWYTTSDQNQLITVKIGSPPTIRTDQDHWYEPAVGGSTAGSVTSGPTVDTTVAAPQIDAAPTHVHENVSDPGVTSLDKAEAEAPPVDPPPSLHPTEPPTTVPDGGFKPDAAPDPAPAPTDGPTTTTTTTAPEPTGSDPDSAVSTGSPDSGSPDSGSPDSGSSYSGSSDSGSSDSGSSDSGSSA